MAEHWHSNKTQIFWTCKTLIEWRTINHIDEISRASGWRLDAITYRLRPRFVCRKSKRGRLSGRPTSRARVRMGNYAR